MCEFKVFLDGELVFEDVIYARIEGERLILKNVLGVCKVLEGCAIVEVNVAQERLTLSRLKS
ncbi:MAG: CooT family nickel-binding protein [Sulfolobales archaeon]